MKSSLDTASEFYWHLKADSSFLRNDGMIDSSLMERLDEKEKHFMKLAEKTRNHCDMRCGA